MSHRADAAIIGAAETTDLGRIPHMSELSLHLDAVRNVIADCGIDAVEIDGVAGVGGYPTLVAQQLGITPTYIDGTSVGGCSFLLHVRHATAAIANGLASMVLITHGQSGRSRVGVAGFRGAGGSPAQQFEAPYGVSGPPTMFPIGVVRYMKEFGLTHEQLAAVPVVQRQWAARNPRAMMRDPITVEDVLASELIAYPMHLLECCLVTDGGGALLITSAERARDMDLPHPPVYVAGGGEAVGPAMISQMDDFTTSGAFRVAGRIAFAEAEIATTDVDHLMIYDAFAHLPIYGLEDLGFVGRGDAGAFIAEGNTAPGGRLPMNTNGGGLSYTHTGMYGMFAIQESVRQLRGTAAAQVPGVEVSVAHGVGGMFAAAATLVLTNRDQR
jgi:acetyl-CoA acetyltransferase